MGSTTPHEPLRVGGDVLPPTLVKRVQPDFSKLPIDLLPNGVGVFETTINRSGRVAGIRVVRSLGPRLDPSVLAALEKWRFHPATQNGRPVAVYFMLTIRIDLR